MTVKELIEKLEQMPDEAEVQYSDAEWGLEDVDSVLLEVHKGKKVVVIE